MNNFSIPPREFGFDIPARIGMHINDICTPALIVDLDVFERNAKTMLDFLDAHNIRLRAHAKTHKSHDIAKYLIEYGGACGICCQKLSEVEALIRAGIDDVLLTNIVVDNNKIERLADLATQARIIVCVDAMQNARALAEVAARKRVTIECLVEIEVGHMICGIEVGDDMLALAKYVDTQPGLRFAGIQAYQGLAQHTYDYERRKELIDHAVAQTRRALALLSSEGLSCEIVGGCGTGTFQLEVPHNVYNEMQCGSYIFMDVDYFRVKDEYGTPLSLFESSLFILTSIVSTARRGRAICDAGLKVQSVDSGLPAIFGHSDLEYVKCIDEHGVILDPNRKLALKDKLMLVPGHCDPTCNLHDWIVGIRKERVETLWPVTARGCSL